MTELVRFPGGKLQNVPITVSTRYNGVTITMHGQYKKNTDGTASHAYIEMEANPHEALRLARDLIKAVEKHAQQTANEARTVRKQLGKIKEVK